MVPNIASTGEARELLALVRVIGGPLQKHGPHNYNFTLEEIKLAHGRAALIVHYMTWQLRKAHNPADHQDADILYDAAKYLQTLSYVLLLRDDVTDEDKMVAVFCTEVIGLLHIPVI